MQDYQFTIHNEEFTSLESPAHSFSLDRSQTLLRNFMLHGVVTGSKCGGKAICGGCRVKILSGHQYCNKPISEEKVILNEQELLQGWRLSCQLYCLRDVTIFIP